MNKKWSSFLHFRHVFRYFFIQKVDVIQNLSNFQLQINFQRLLKFKSDKENKLRKSLHNITRANFREFDPIESYRESNFEIRIEVRQLERAEEYRLSSHRRKTTIIKSRIYSCCKQFTLIVDY